jgi:hypothetical protein
MADLPFIRWVVTHRLGFEVFNATLGHYLDSRWLVQGLVIVLDTDYKALSRPAEQLAAKYHRRGPDDRG